MQTQFSAALLATAEGKEADAILRRCVHCGFCTATCPTYQLLGDELDGPRGRIYLIKQMLEGEVEGESTRLHLDRCLICRSCETTCPSGVEYSRLLDIGRAHVEKIVKRPWLDRLTRWGMRQVIPYPLRFKWLLKLAHPLSPLFPRAWREALPPKPMASDAWTASNHDRRVILFQGCVQSVVATEINQAAAKLLDHLGISAIRVSGEACCGALDQHLSAPETASAFMRSNIDRWWPLIEDGVEAIVGTASACGLQVKDYGHLLRADPAYADKAIRVSALVKDISEVLHQEGPKSPASLVENKQRVAFQSPCTLQHGQKLGGIVEGILQNWGFEPVAVENAHMCCGSAGTYSVTQPELSHALRANKLEALQKQAPAVIASANIGCLLHLRAKAEVPVKHWIELLAERC